MHGCPFLFEFFASLGGADRCFKKAALIYPSTIL